MNLYGIEVETSTTVHDDIPVIKTPQGKYPHRRGVRATGTTTGGSYNLEESVDELYGAEAIVLSFKYDHYVSAHEQEASTLRFYIDPKEDDKEKGRFRKSAKIFARIGTMPMPRERRNLAVRMFGRAKD